MGTITTSNEKEHHMATIVEQLRKEIASRKEELKSLEAALAALSGAKVKIGTKLTEAARKSKAGKAPKAAKTAKARPGWTPERRAKMAVALAARKAAKSAS